MVLISQMIMKQLILVHKQMTKCTKKRLQRCRQCGRPARARGKRTRNHPSGLRFHQGFIAASLRSKTPSAGYYELTARRFRCICPLQPFVIPLFQCSFSINVDVRSVNVWMMNKGNFFSKCSIWNTLRTVIHFIHLSATVTPTARHKENLDIFCLISVGQTKVTWSLGASLCVST